MDLLPLTVTIAGAFTLTGLTNGTTYTLAMRTYECGLR